MAIIFYIFPKPPFYDMSGKSHILRFNMIDVQDG